jgi:hypothetical protein
MAAYPSDIKAASKLKFGHRKRSEGSDALSQQLRSNAIVPRLPGRVLLTTAPTPKPKQRYAPLFGDMAPSIS